MQFLSQPWPWYVGGLIIGLSVPLFLLLGNKPFGISSSLRHMCAACIPANISFFKYNWKKEVWNLFFVAGVVLGAFLATTYLDDPAPIQLSKSTQVFLKENHINNLNGLAPAEVFSFSSLLSLKGFFFIVVGGFLVGFGTRYANGCTSGHSIMGLSNLQFSSLVATICFMVGGILFSWFVVPFLLNL